MIYKNGEQSKAGDVIRWSCWDSEEFTTWTFTGLVTSMGVIYLGGGFDFGMAIGKLQSYEDVQSEADNNDPSEAGIQRVGVASDLSRYISYFSAE